MLRFSLIVDTLLGIIGSLSSTILKNNDTNIINFPYFNFYYQISDLLIFVYRLINENNFPVNNEMLHYALDGYSHDRDKPLLGFFIQYLVDVHHLIPSQDDIKIIKQRNNHVLLKLLRIDQGLADKNRFKR